MFPASPWRVFVLHPPLALRTTRVGAKETPNYWVAMVDEERTPTTACKKTPKYCVAVVGEGRTPTRAPLSLFVKLLLIIFIPKIHHAAHQILEFDLVFKNLFTNKGIGGETVQHKFH